MRIAARITEEAPCFDAPALLDALAFIGYPPSSIRFRSHPSLLHQGALFQRVELYQAPRYAVVFVNIGLLSSQGPLPLYFFELLRDQRDDDMAELLWFFDQHLLAARFAAQYPERDPLAMPDWTTTRRMLLLMLRLPALSGVHWLLSALFPELEVEVRRAQGSRRLLTPDFLIGGAELGNGQTMGGVTDLPVDGVEALLVCNEEVGQDAVFWINEAQRRLMQSVLPLLAEQNPYMYLRVQLVLRRRPEHVRLARDRFMGVNRLYGSGDDMPSYEQLLLWSGEVRLALASEQMNFSLPREQRGIASRKE
jgi:hypothetical protein